VTLASLVAHIGRDSPLCLPWTAIAWGSGTPRTDKHNPMEPSVRRERRWPLAARAVPPLPLRPQPSAVVSRPPPCRAKRCPPLIPRCRPRPGPRCAPSPGPFLAQPLLNSTASDAPANDVTGRERSMLYVVGRLVSSSDGSVPGTRTGGRAAVRQRATGRLVACFQAVI
jgi:hypothetical protein